MPSIFLVKQLDFHFEISHADFLLKDGRVDLKTRLTNQSDFAIKVWLPPSHNALRGVMSFNFDVESSKNSIFTSKY